MSSTPRDAYRQICPWKSQTWQRHDAWSRGLCWQMPWLTTEVSCYRQQLKGHVALYIHPLYVLRLIDGHLPWYRYTHIQLHAASYSCCFRSYGKFFNVYPWMYFWWVHWQCCGGLTGVCILVVSWWVRYWMKRPLVSSIRIRCYLAEVFV